jgi:NTE family protein
MRLRRKAKVILSLGAGGARGLAHIGVIRALVEEDIPIDGIAGISFGALIGALYSLHLDIDTVQEKLRDYIRSPLFREMKQEMEVPDPDHALGLLDRLSSAIRKGYFYTRALSQMSVIDADAPAFHMKELLGEHDFIDLNIPFRCSSVDLITGEPIIFTDGPLAIALQASCATPGFFPPVRFHGMLLVDGGVAEMMPVFLAKTFKPDFIVGVDVTREIDTICEDTDIRHSLDIVFRSYEITRDFINVYTSKEVDFVIRPEIGSCQWSDFGDMDRYVQAGYKAAKARLPELKRKIFWVDW